MGLDESLLRSTVGGGSSESCHKQGQTTLAAHNLAAQTARGHFKLWLRVSFLHLKVSIEHPAVFFGPLWTFTGICNCAEQH